MAWASDAASADAAPLIALPVAIASWRASSAWTKRRGGRPGISYWQKLPIAVGLEEKEVTMPTRNITSLFT
jgi:hypothetical protein